MGINKIQEIVDILIAEGKNEIPIAVIQNGTLRNQRAVAGFATTIVNDIVKAEIGSPAIIVIGEVVRFSSIEGIKESLLNNGISLAGQM
jgi:uroporphyrin-III C-methyltransferase